MKWTIKGAGALVYAASMLVGANVARADTEITMWSTWVDQPAKIAFVNEAARRFEEKHPGAKVKVTWYDKKPLFSALNVALRSGQGPDVFFTEVEQLQYIQNKMLEPMNTTIDWTHVEPWVKDAWTHDGNVYGLALETQSIDFFVNKDLMAKFGHPLPANRQLSQDDFLDLVKKARAAGVTPISTGVGDREFPGLYLSYGSLLKALGPDDYTKLLEGKLSYKDPRVVKTLDWVKTVIDAGAFPENIATMKIAEAHYYFHTKPGAVMFPMGSFYAGRAFVAPEKGGQPADFPLEVMRFPAIDGAACNDCEQVAAGGSYSINSASPNKELAAAFLNEMTTPDMANLWMQTVHGEIGIKGDPSTITGEHASYFASLLQAESISKPYIGTPEQLTKGTCYNALTQVMNVAFPSGLISVADAVDRMDSACYQQ